ncbi:hypothetical protein [Haladaptatus sp. DYSN1]|uniref:hypothetical protein n=1 Tax=unclassified Haladaptatus TaxID=2622732 RepID=UPI0024071E24|nr:hypothetical protein [Haladaptatus sp. DYSN1]
MESAVDSFVDGLGTTRHAVGVADRYEARRRGGTVALTVGYLSLLAAVVVAHAAPATRYELSIYEATPVAFWIGVAAAFLIAIVVALYGAAWSLRAGSVLLAGTATTSVVGLPLIRGYYFYGLLDSLIHLGWARSLDAGVFTVYSIPYPGSHLFAAVLGRLTGFAMPTAMLFTVLVFTVVYFLFVALTARLLLPSSRVAIVAAFSAFLLLPINSLATHVSFHPFTLATLFFPLFLYLLVKHMSHEANDDRLPQFVSAASLVLPLVAFVMVILHPQLTLNVLLFVLGMAGVQLLYRLLQPNSAAAGYRAIYGQVFVLLVIFVFWVNQHQSTFNTLDQTLAAVEGLLLGTAAAGQVISSQSDSAADIGVSLAELFVKLFLVSVVYLAASALLIVGWLRGRAVETRVGGLLPFFVWGSLAFLPVVAAQFIGDISTYFFRHLGFAMVIATILGAVGITRLAGRVSSGSLSTLVRPLIVLGVVALVALSLVSLFPSPYIFLPGQHVAAQHMEGYQTSFNAQPADKTIWYGAVRTGIDRYEAAFYDEPFSIHSGPAPESAMLTGLRPYYENHPEEVVRRDHWFVVTQTDIEREVDAYRELRYSRASFTAITTERGVHLVQSNGEYHQFYVDIGARPPVPEGTFRENT